MADKLTTVEFGKEWFGKNIAVGHFIAQPSIPKEIDRIFSNESVIILHELIIDRDQLIDRLLRIDSIADEYYKTKN